MVERLRLVDEAGGVAAAVVRAVDQLPVVTGVVRVVGQVQVVEVLVDVFEEEHEVFRRLVEAEQAGRVPRGGIVEDGSVGGVHFFRDHVYNGSISEHLAIYYPQRIRYPANIQRVLSDAWLTQSTSSGWF